MASRTSKNIGGEWPKYGTISSQSGSIHTNKGSIHVTDDLRYEDDEEDYDQDDNGYTRFVRLRSDSGNFFTEGLSQEQLKLVVNLVINLSEWYAFAIFGYFSDVIGGVFFPPSQTIQSALVESFATFGSAFVTRPIGGLCLGYLGDKYGRKLSLEASVLLMAIATLSMSCLPTYSQVGAVSYVLLAVLRLVQGLSVGGQLMGSLVYAVESKPTKHWGYHGSMIMAAANFGNVMSGVTVYFLRVEMSEEALERIGWRIPNFVVGVVLSLCGLCLKYLLEEDSMHGIELNKDALHHSNPLKLACAPTNRRSLLAACMVPMLWSAGFWLTFVWMATYMFKLIPTPMSAPAAFGVNSVALFLGVCVFYPIAGILSDIYGRRIIMTIGGVGYGALAPMLLIVIGSGKAIEALAAQTLLGMFLSLWGGPMMAWLVESFDPQTRLTSAAVGYNLGAMVAGVAPVAATLLVDQLGPWTPGVLLSLLAVIGLIGLWAVAPKPNPNQTDEERMQLHSRRQSHSDQHARPCFDCVEQLESHQHDGLASVTKCVIL